MYLTVTIDTEEDNWGEYQRSSYSVENLKRIPKLQQLFIAHGVRPTYLMSYPVATSPLGVEILAPCQEAALCEIGSHLHPWNTPPIAEARTAFNSYLCNLDASLQYRKMTTLHKAITARFGVMPTSFRTGRWGFSDDVAKNLIALGYTIDTSISPASDWSEYEGPDYSERSHEPFLFRMGDSARQPGGSLLEIPATIGFVQNHRALATSIYWTIVRRVPRGKMILSALSKLRVLNHVALSPETHSASQMIRLATALLKRGTRVINMFFHSPSLLENCSPFVRTPADVEDFIARIGTFLAFARSAGLRSVTMSELRPVDVGASTVKVLPAGRGDSAACQDTHLFTDARVVQ